MDFQQMTKNKSIIQFCPICSNYLLVEKQDGLRFQCSICQYYFPIKKKIKNTIPQKTKKVDDILGGSEAWKNVETAQATCPKCGNDKAFLKQIQMRSADEPMTEVYKCTNFDCQYSWIHN